MVIYCRELALLHGPQGATWNKGAPPPQIRDNPLFEVEEPFIYNLLSNQCSCSIYPRYEPWLYCKNPLFEVEELFLFRIVNVQVPPNSLQREEVNNNDLGRPIPWWGGRKEGTSGLNHCRSLFLVGFYHPVRCHPPDYGRQWFDGASGMWSASTSLSLWEREDRLSSLQNLTQVGITDVLRWVGECEEGWSKDLCQDIWLQSSVCWCAGSW